MSNSSQGASEPTTIEESPFSTKRIFISDLTNELEEFTIYKYCSAYGEIVKCQIMKEPKTGMSRGFGFITYGMASSAQAILNARPHYIGHHKINVKPAFPTSESIASAMANSIRQQHSDSSDTPRTRRLFVVYNISEASRNNLTEPAIFGYLSTFGVVKEIVHQFSSSAEFKHQKDPVNEYWIVEFLDENSVERCMAKGQLHFVQSVRVYAKKIISEQDIIRQKRQQQQQREEAARQLEARKERPIQQQQRTVIPTPHFYGQFPLSSFIGRTSSSLFQPSTSYSSYSNSSLLVPPPPPPSVVVQLKSNTVTDHSQSNLHTAKMLHANNHQPKKRANPEELLKEYGYQQNASSGNEVPSKQYKNLQF